MVAARSLRCHRLQRLKHAALKDHTWLPVFDRRRQTYLVRCVKRRVRYACLGSAAACLRAKTPLVGDRREKAIVGEILKIRHEPQSVIAACPCAGNNPAERHQCLSAAGKTNVLFKRHMLFSVHSDLKRHRNQSFIKFPTRSGSRVSHIPLSAQQKPHFAAESTVDMNRFQYSRSHPFERWLL